MRVLQAGGRIVNDPGLVSRELAPDVAEVPVAAADALGPGLVPGVLPAPRPRR